MSDLSITKDLSREHTPGPWTYEKEMSSGPHLEKTYLFAHGDVIGRVYTDATRDNSQANARLIAAAPDLLAALEAMWDSACTNRTSTPSKAAFLQAHAAIAKAKGAPPWILANSPA